MCVATTVGRNSAKHTTPLWWPPQRQTLIVPRFDPPHKHCLNGISCHENTPTSRNADRPVGRPPARRCLDVPSASTRRPPGVAITGSPREHYHPGQPRPAGGAIVEDGGTERDRLDCDEHSSTEARGNG